MITVIELKTTVSRTVLFSTCHKDITYHGEDTLRCN